MYLELLKKYKKQYGFKLFALALMPNQLDLLMELKGGTTISVVMHNLNSSYTKYFNGRYARKGHVFRERFKSVVVEKEPYLLNLVHYIHTNPVRLGYSKDPTDYTFSSYLSYLYDGASPHEASQNIRDILGLNEEVREVLSFLGHVAPEKKGFADFVAGISQEEMEELAQKLRRTGLLGSKEFVDSVLSQMRSKQAEETGKRNMVKPAIALSIAVVIAGITAAGLYIQKNVESKEKELEFFKVTKEREIYERLRREYASKATLSKLDGTEWAIEVKPMTKAAQAGAALDKIQFSEGKVASKGMLSQGFTETNYTLTAQDDGTLVWETMQQNTSGDTVFWRGEEREGRMKGTVSRRPAAGSPQDFVFTSIGYNKAKE